MTRHTPIRVAMLSYPEGGYTPAGYDIGPLAACIREAGRPHLIVLPDARAWDLHGSRTLHEVLALLDRTTARPYVGLLGWEERGGSGPALIWDPNILRLLQWSGADLPDLPLESRNQALLEVRKGHGAGSRFQVIARKYSPLSRIRRLRQAEDDLVWAGPHMAPALLAGDLASTASGPHLPQVDWESRPVADRMRQAVQDRHGVWRSDTRPLDLLIGRREQDERTGGAGWLAACELATTSYGDRFPPFLNEHLLVDWMLFNPRMAKWFDPTTYRAHRPPRGGLLTLTQPMLTATLNVPAPE